MYGDLVLRSVAGVGTSTIKLTLSTRRSTVTGVEDPACLLVAYDEQLRTDAETPSAVSVTRQGPLRLVTFAGGRGFITYRDLGGASAPTIRGFVQEALVHYRADPGITRVEWKTRGHDHAPGLHGALLAHGFVPGDPESIMIGATKALALDVPLPEGVALRRITAQHDVRAMSALQDEVFGDPVSKVMAEPFVQSFDYELPLPLARCNAPGAIASRRYPPACEATDESAARHGRSGCQGNP